MDTCSTASKIMPCLRFYNPEDIDIRGWECPAEFASNEEFNNHLIETYGEDFAFDKKANFPDGLCGWISSSDDYYYVGKLIEDCNIHKKEFPALVAWVNANCRTLRYSEWVETFKKEYTETKSKTIDSFTVLMAIKEAKNFLRGENTETKKAVEKALAIFEEIILK